MKPDAIAKQNVKPARGEAESAAAAPGSSPASGVNADAILRAIQSSSRNRGNVGGSEHRQATRYHYCVPMTLHIDDPRKAGTRVIRAASSNISTGGFAFIFDAAISPGSTVRAQFDSLPGKPQIAGLVRSCLHICGTQHRIGVEYQ
jgi:hypothetical protein